MRSAFAGFLTLALASTAMASESVARWNDIVGAITAQNVDNPVADVSRGTFAWSAQGGHARVNLSSGRTSFEVDGLVINGTAFSGTPGPVTQVEGTLVCNAGLACSACARLRSLSSDRALRWV